MSEVWRVLLEQFSATSGLEWFATVTGFLCVYLATKEHILNWPIAILSVTAFAVLFYQSKLYGNAFLQIYFLVTSVYGWYYWSRSKKENTASTITSFALKQMMLVILVVFVLTLLLGWFLATYTDTDVPYIDGFCTAMSFTAQFLMTRKVLQNWLLWIVVDLFYIPLYIYKGFMLTVILYVAYTIMATNGYIQWRKSWKKARLSE